MNDIREEIRAAFESEQSAFPPSPALQADVIAAVNSHIDAAAPPQKGAGRNLNWLMVAAAVLVTIAVVAGLMSGRLTNRHVNVARPSPAAQACVPGATTQPSNRFATVHGYITYSDGSDIWAVDPNHPGNRVSLGPSYGMTPIAWSRDGSRLLLRTAGDNAFSGDLCVMNADGSQARLTRDGLSYEGSFSNHDSIVIARQDDGLYLVSTNGDAPRLVAKKFASWNLESPAWSPDESRIAYMVYYEFDPKGPSYQIWTVNPDGTDPQRLVDLGWCAPGGCSGHLAWSPDGTMLAFDSARGPAPTYPTTSLRPLAIYVVHADGSGLQRLNDSGTWPSWSPDGSRIAFMQGAGVVTMARDGSDVRQVEGVFPNAPYHGFAWNPVVGG